MREYIRVDHQIMLIVVLSFFIALPFHIKKFRKHIQYEEKLITVDMGKFNENDLV